MFLEVVDKLKMRKSFFYKLDMLLPRSLANIPYIAAYLDTEKKLAELLPGSKAWFRNTTRQNAFVLGVSDLDLTILLMEGFDREIMRKFLSSQKKIWKFIGETNLYFNDDLRDLSHFINLFELYRDPDLLSLFEKKHIPINVNSFLIDKLIFLLRLVQSDKDLEKYPWLRQKKWKHHLNLLGIEYKKDFDRNGLLKIIQNLLNDYPKLFDSVLDWDFKRTLPGFDVFHSPLSERFKVLFPHQHLWFHSEDDISFLSSLDDFEKELIKRQIDWEIWGIYTQRYWLSIENITAHLSRLMDVYKILENGEEYVRRARFLNRVFRI